MLWKFIKSGHSESSHRIWFFFCRIDLTLQCKGEHFIQIFRAIWLGKTCQIADSSGTQGWYGPCNFRGSGRMKTKKLFWRFSDLGRRHVKVVYYFAPIKSEIFYNSDCYERVRKFVILKVHRIAIFFSQRLVNLLYSYTELSSGFLPKTSYFDLIPLFKLLKPKHPVKTSRWSNIDHFNQLSDANFVTTTVTSSKCGQNGTNQ